VDEHVLAAVVTDDEAEALLRIEELDDALALADDLGRHSAPTAAAEASAAATAEATASAAVAAAAVPITAATATIAAPAAESAASAAVAAPLLEPATGELTGKIVTTAEIVALIAAAASAIPLAPSIETHAVKTSVCPQ
jgi:hypothetical protein